MAYKYFEGTTTDEWVGMNTTGTTQSRFKNDGPGDLRLRADGGDEICVKSGDEFGFIAGYNLIEVKTEPDGFHTAYRLLAQ